MIQKRDTEVIYLRGNHDDFIGRLLPLQFDRLNLVEEYILETAQGRYLVLHGDVFDGIIKHMVILAHLGDAGYALLLRLNRFYNWFRALRGKEYFSLSQAIKARVKQAVSFIGKFEDQIASLARDRGCRGVICGHIHTPADKMIGDIHYLNSGDWVESLTAIVEHHDGRFELLAFQQFLAQFPGPPLTRSMKLMSWRRSRPDGTDATPSSPMKKSSSSPPAMGKAIIVPPAHSKVLSTKTLRSKLN